MPSFSGAVSLLVFGIVLYVLLTNLVNWLTAFFRRRTKAFVRKTASPGCDVVPPGVQGAVPRNKSVTPKIRTAPPVAKVMTVHSVSQVFAAKGKSR